jgi:hypothetical protein
MHKIKKYKAIFWLATALIILFEGVLPVIVPQSESARTGALHLGYPEYFGQVLIVFKFLGVLVLIVPQIPKWIKEWAYAGFTYDLIFASISHTIVDGVGFLAFFPLIILVILATSYVSFHRIISMSKN